MVGFNLEIAVRLELSYGEDPDKPTFALSLAGSYNYPCNNVISVAGTVTVNLETWGMGPLDAEVRGHVARAHSQLARSFVCPT